MTLKGIWDWMFRRQKGRYAANYLKTIEKKTAIEISREAEARARDRKPRPYAEEFVRKLEERDRKEREG